MKHYNYSSIVSCLILLISSCSSPCPYDEPVICTRYKDLKGPIRLDTNNSSWLNIYRLDQQFTLDNNRGFTSDYVVSRKSTDVNSYTVGATSINIKCCGSDGKEETRLTYEKEVIQIDGDAALGPIFLTRAKDFSLASDLFDTTLNDSIPERLTISMLNSSATFNPDDTSSLGDINYRDTITLAGKLYSKIHVVYVRYSYGYIKPYEYYYSRDKGFVGVKLTNNEVWIVK